LIFNVFIQKIVELGVGGLRHGVLCDMYICHPMLFIRVLSSLHITGFPRLLESPGFFS